MDLSADFFKSRPPGTYHEISATLKGRREVHIKLTDIAARMCGYPLNREYRLEAWEQKHGPRFT